MSVTFYLAPAEASPEGSGTYPTIGTNYITSADGVPTSTYTPSSGTGRLIPGVWDNTGVVTYTMPTAKVTTVQRIRMGRFVSPPLTGSISLTPDGNSSTPALQMTWLFAVSETNLNVNVMGNKPIVYAWRPSTGTVVGVLNDWFTGAQEPTAASSTQTSGATSTTPLWNRSAPNTPVNMIAGDILVIEPWLVFTQGMATAYSVSFVFGGTTVITAQNTVVTTPASYVQFTSDFPVGLPSSYIKGDIYGTAAVQYVSPFTFLSSSLTGISRVSAVMSNGLLAQSSMVAKATITANLTTQILMTSSLKSISNTFGWFPQSHELSVGLVGKASNSIRGDISSPLPGLRLMYSGGSSAISPTQSLGGGIASVPYKDQIAVLSSPVDGLVLNSSSGFTPGTYALNYQDSTKKLTIEVPPFSFSAYLTGITTPSIGTNELGYLLLSVDYALFPFTDFSRTVTITEAANTLFQDPDTSLMAVQTTEYRCLYLKNTSTGDATEVSISVSGPLEEITVGTEFTLSFLLGDTSTSSALLRRSKSTSVGGRASSFSLVSSPQIGLRTQSGGSPFVFISGAAGQASDGVSVDLPLTIVDATDSTNVLSSVSFGNTVSWPSVKAGKSVTFWVRKVQQANMTLPIFENLRFKITATI